MPYLIVTGIGIAPRTVAAAMIGDGIARAMQATGEGEPDFSAPRWLWIAGTVAMLVVLGVLGLVANRAIGRVTGSGRTVGETTE